MLYTSYARRAKQGFEVTDSHKIQSINSGESGGGRGLGGLEAEGGRRFPSVLYGMEWGGPHWSHCLFPTAAAAEVLPSSAVHEVGDRLLGHLCSSTATVPGTFQHHGGGTTPVNLMQTCRLVPPGLPGLSKQCLSIYQGKPRRSCIII